MTGNNKFFRTPWYGRKSGVENADQTSPSPHRQEPSRDAQHGDRQSDRSARTAALSAPEPVLRSAVVRPASGIVSPYLTCKEAAIYLRMSHRSLERLRVNGGGGPQFRRGSPGKKAKILYHIDDLNAWLERRFNSTSEYET